MTSIITNGIKVTALSEYVHDNSKPSLGQYIHSYEITIENLTDKTVQLLSRHWKIYNARAVCREVEGEGVVGQQPILESFGVFTYSSWSPLTTPVGKMEGTFTMMDVESGATFKVEVPPFKLIADFVGN